MEVEKFDPSTLMQGVKDRIKSTFVSLIPDDQWEGMVQKEIDSFFTSENKILFSVKTEAINYSKEKTTGFSFSGENLSPFRQMVWMFCIESTQAALQSQITKDYFNSGWSSGPQDLTENMKNLISSSIPVAINTYFENIARNMTHVMQQTIQNNS